jgi:alpha-N-arabinofuranosidase
MLQFSQLTNLTHWTDKGHASFTVHADAPSPHPIPVNITGKFCEHLGTNIYNGMCAQILRNPTFADYPFFTGQKSPDGLITLHWQRDRIEDSLRNIAMNTGMPENAASKLCRDYFSGLAAMWIGTDSPESCRFSPDTGPYGGRAQRVEIRNAGAGIGQWIWLPIDRVRKYEVTIHIRSKDIKNITIAVSANECAAPVCSSIITGIDSHWRLLHTTLELPEGSPDTSWFLSISTPETGQFVIERAVIYPSDHVNGADPDVIRMLKDSHLPVLRWPGGNFVSAYHWRDGVGPAEKRPTLPNPSWGNVEPNLFGTDDFIAFCQAVECEPMICINAGNGTPEEAAQWIEYCNGSIHSPMGSLRAANGHREPYNIRLWEVGNELWGSWQAHWTTPRGYADRYQDFAKAMLAADPSIELIACGAPVLWGDEWNETLINETHSILHAITDHPLIGGDVSRSIDPLDIYRDFMGVPNILKRRWASLLRSMSEAGIPTPELAVTELQMFAHLKPSAEGEADHLNNMNLVNPSTLAEALYDILIYHACLRLAPCITLVTHSATVNHGGGLRKEREKVYANPCHYAQSAFAAMAGATPLPVSLQCDTISMPIVLADVHNAKESEDYSRLDAFAAKGEDGIIYISLVNTGAEGNLSIEGEIKGVLGRLHASGTILTADVPWARNTLETPNHITPTPFSVEINDHRIRFTMPACSVGMVQITII